MVSNSLLNWSAEPGLEAEPQPEPIRPIDGRASCIELVGEVEALGMALVMRDGSPALLRRGLSVPSDIIQRLRHHRAGLIAYLSEIAKPEPRELAPHERTFVPTEWWHENYPGYPRVDLERLPWAELKRVKSG